MTDTAKLRAGIITRNGQHGSFIDHDGTAALMCEAADEIEELRRQVESLRKAYAREKASERESGRYWHDP